MIDKETEAKRNPQTIDFPGKACICGFIQPAGNIYSIPTLSVIFLPTGGLAACGLSFRTIQKISAYSPVKRPLGAIFLIRRDSRQANRKVANTSPTPAARVKPAGTIKVHFTMPRPLINPDSRGLMPMQLSTVPTITEIITVGIKLKAVCRISCPVVYPKAFRMPYSLFFAESRFLMIRYSTKMMMIRLKKSTAITIACINEI